MNATLLLREALPESKLDLDKVSDDLVQAGVNQLAQEAKEILGYGLSPMTADTYKFRAKEKISLVFDKLRLTNALRELDIRPFNLAAVHVYQYKQKFAANKWRNRNARAFHLSVATFLVSLCIGVILWVVSTWSPAVGRPLCFFGVLGTTAIVSGITTYIISEMNLFLPTRQWVKTRIEHYDEPVPEFALQTAILLKKKLPEAEFYIEHLAYTPDPFLMVQLGKSDLVYIEVWDESNFKAKREA